MIDFKSKKDILEEIDGVKLKFTNLDKVFWPDEGYTKGNLLTYYEKITPFILPYLIGRPESLLRFPNGIDGKNFYQKNIAGLEQEWMKTVDVPSESQNEITRYLVCNNQATLLYMINLGCIDLNPWSSRVGSLNKPDFLIIDLDPLNIEFDCVIEAAKAVKKVLDLLEIPGFPKTSGATGMHIYLPMGTKYSYDQVKKFAEILVDFVYMQSPDFTSVERLTKKRENKVYLDFLQNIEGQTLAAPYCVRPRPKAPVSTPLSWEEVKEGGFKPEDFNILNIFKRLERVGDLYKPLIEHEGININETIQKIENL